MRHLWIAAGVLVLGACSSHSGGTGGDGGTSCAAHATCGQCSADTHCDWCGTTLACIDDTSSFSCPSIDFTCASSDGGTSHDAAGGGLCYSVTSGSCTDPTAYPYYCGSGGCCDSTHPYFCPSDALCYDSESAAAAACPFGLCVSCVYASGGGFDAGPPVLQHEVDCSATGTTHFWMPTCSCTPLDDNTGAVDYLGSACGDSSSDRKLCCAGSGYPGTGSCDCTDIVTWACVNIGSDLCSCGFLTSTAGMSLTTVCDNVPAADGRPWYCCNTAYDDCTCRENYSGLSCASGETTVSNCAPSPGTPRTSCPSGTHSVTSCSSGL